MSDSLWRKISRNTASNLATTGITLAAGFFLMPFCIARMGMTEFGIWLLLNSIVDHMGLLDSGLSPTLVKFSSAFIAKKDYDGLNRTASVVFTIHTAAGILGAAFLVACSFGLVDYFKVPAERMADFRAGLCLTSIQIGLAFPMSVWGSITSGLEDVHVSNIVASAIAVLRAIGVVALLLAGHGFVALVVLGLALYFVRWIFFAAWVKRRVPEFSVRLAVPPRVELIRLAKFSAVLFLGGMSAKLVFESARLIIPLFWPVAYVSVYEVPLRLSNYARNVITAAYAVMPTASALHAVDDLAALRSVFLTVTRYLFSLYVCVAAGLALLGGPFVRLWIGPSVGDPAPVLAVLLLGGLFQCQNVAAYPLLIGTGDLGTFRRAMAVYPVVSLVTCFALVRPLGLLGAAAGTAASCLVAELYLTRYVLRKFGVTYSQLLAHAHRPALVSVLPAVVACGGYRAVFPVSGWLSLAVAAAVFAVVWAASFVLLGIGPIERRRMFAVLAPAAS